MRRTLHPHPDYPHEAVISIDVEVARSGGGTLQLTYFVAGAVERVRRAETVRSRRQDGLWQTTCFEVFVRTGEGDAYREFNFASSGAWAAYAFNGYRNGMMELETAPPNIEFRTAPALLELSATFVVTNAPLRLALSAVIEETDGSKSYWALAHPPGKADFHHPDSFVLQLPADPA